MLAENYLTINQFGFSFVSGAENSTIDNSGNRTRKHMRFFCAQSFPCRGESVNQGMVPRNGLGQAIRLLSNCAVFTPRGTTWAENHVLPRRFQRQTTEAFMTKTPIEQYSELKEDLDLALYSIGSNPLATELTDIERIRVLMAKMQRCVIAARRHDYRQFRKQVKMRRAA